METVGLPGQDATCTPLEPDASPQATLLLTTKVYTKFLSKLNLALFVPKSLVWERLRAWSKSIRRGEGGGLVQRGGGSSVFEFLVKGG